MYIRHSLPARSQPLARSRYQTARSHHDDPAWYVAALLVAAEGELDPYSSANNLCGVLKLVLCPSALVRCWKPQNPAHTAAPALCPGANGVVSAPSPARAEAR